MRVAGVLQALHKDYRIQADSTTSFADLRNGPVVLVGSYNNDWTIRLTGLQRFKFEQSGDIRWIADRQNPARKDWAVNLATPIPELNEDYALISRLLDPSDRPHGGCGGRTSEPRNSRGGRVPDESGVPCGDNQTSSQKLGAQEPPGGPDYKRLSAGLIPALPGLWRPHYLVDCRSGNRSGLYLLNVAASSSSGLGAKDETLPDLARCGKRSRTAFGCEILLRKCPNNILPVNTVPVRILAAFTPPCDGNYYTSPVNTYSYTEDESRSFKSIYLWIFSITVAIWLKPVNRHRLRERYLRFENEASKLNGYATLIPRWYAARDRGNGRSRFVPPL